MTTSTRNLVCGMLAACLVALPAMLISAERRGAARGRDAAADARTVELFAAIESKEVEVRLIPKDATETKVLITNKTDKPLNVRLPEAFAGVPVLAQAPPRGGGGARAGGAGGNAANNQNQSMGGGMGGGMMGGGMGMGMMSVAPEKVVQFKVGTVCLEHGKKDPRPSVKYEIKPIEAFTTDPKVKQLLVAMANEPQMDQGAAQAAAWNLTGGLTWEQLAAKRAVHINGASHQWFTPGQVQAGMLLAHQATVRAEQEAAKEAKESRKSPGETEAAADEVIGRIE